MVPREIKYIIGVILAGMFAIFLFYPPDLFIPEGWHPIIPDIFLHYPWLWTLGRLVPFELFILLSVVGVLFVRGLLKA